MHAGQKRFLEERHEAATWRGRSKHADRLVRAFALEGSELRGWTLQRAQRDDGGKPAVLRSIWSRDPPGKTLLAIDVFECKSVVAAHDQLLEVLGQMQSGVVERQAGKTAPGDVAFGCGKTMALFARANIVVLIRNAGPTVVPVDAIAHAFDALVIKRLGRKPPTKPKS
jgi:hypothetical protein